MPVELGIWDTERPPRVADAEQCYAQMTKSMDTDAEPGPRIAAFVKDCQRRWQDPAFTTKRCPLGLILSLDQEHATELYPELGQMTEKHGLVFYDRQSGMIRIPSRLSFNAEPQPSAPKKGRFFDLLRRRRR